jgi:hypothetical protein
MSESCVQSRIHLQVIDGKSSNKLGSIKGKLSPEQVNQRMLLLLIICLVLVGSTVGAVGYLGAE